MRKYKFILLLFLTMMAFNACFINEKAKKAIKEDEYRGIISRIYEDPEFGYRQMRTFDVAIGKDTVQIMAGFFRGSWDYATVGDSIIKPQGELYLIIKKKDNTSKQFEYDL